MGITQSISTDLQILYQNGPIKISIPGRNLISYRFLPSENFIILIGFTFYVDLNQVRQFYDHNSISDFHIFTYIYIKGE